MLESLHIVVDHLDLSVFPDKLHNFRQSRSQKNRLIGHLSYSQKSSLVVILKIHFGNRDVEFVADLIFQTLYNLPLVF